MTPAVTVNPDTKVSNSCNNWFCCTKKKKSVNKETVAKVVANQRKMSYESTNHHSEYTYDAVHIHVDSHDRGSERK